MLYKYCFIFFFFLLQQQNTLKQTHAFATTIKQFTLVFFFFFFLFDFHKRFYCSVCFNFTVLPLFRQWKIFKCLTLKTPQFTLIFAKFFLFLYQNYVLKNFVVVILAFKEYFFQPFNWKNPISCFAFLFHLPFSFKLFSLFSSIPIRFFLICLL